MPLLETLLLSVGTAIAKSILKHWLKDDSVVDAGGGLLDVLKTKTSEVLAQKRAERQFEAIGEAAAMRLLPILEIEGAGLDEGTRESLAQSLADTIQAANLSVDLLVQSSLDASQLARRLKELPAAFVAGYSPDERHLLERLIDETSKSIIDISSSLPRFHERVFADLVRRDNELIDIANRTLAKLALIEQQTTTGPAEEARRFEINYLGEVARVLNRVELFGAMLDDASRRHSLDVAYITLTARPRPLAPNNAAQSSPGATEPAPITALLQQNHRLLIRGQAGSGKTTLLKWIAVRSASRRFAADLADWNLVIPFFISLSNYNDAELPSPEAFPGLIAPLIAATMPPKWVHAKLDSGQAIILIDSIDEVSAQRRAKVQDWMSSLVALYDRSRFIVTARPYAIDHRWFEQQQFAQVELQPMRPDDVDTFVDYWHLAVREELTEVEQQKTMGPLAASLKATLRRQPAVFSLATNPLLCAMICALNRDRNRNIPQDVIDLYQACCNMFIERRESERSIANDDYPPLNQRQKRSLLEHLAYWMHRNGYPMVPWAEALVYLAPRVNNLTGMPDGVTGHGVLRLLIERVGLLREPMEDYIEFAHPAFRDFLAACALVEDMDINALVASAHQREAHEVVVLAVGMFPRKYGEQVINGLIERGDHEEPLRPLLYRLAGDCAEQAPELSTEVKVKVQERMARLSS